MTDRELLEQALEALDGVEALLSSMDVTHLLIYGEVDKAITALRERLAQPEQEPLTEKRILELYSFWIVDCQDIVGFARAIERLKLGAS